jgi:hypothetical protein
MASSTPELFKPVRTRATNPAAGEMHQQIAISVPHVVTTLNVGVELSLRIYPDMIAHKLVLEHKVLEGILLGTVVFLAHQHGVISHHLKCPARECGATEECTPCVDTLVILGDQNIDIFHAEALGRVDVGRVFLQLAIEYRGSAHNATFNSVRRQNLVNKVVVGSHHDDICIYEPDPLGVWVEVKSLGNGRNLGPCLYSDCQLSPNCSNMGLQSLTLWASPMS